MERNPVVNLQRLSQSVRLITLLIIAVAFVGTRPVLAQEGVLINSVSISCTGVSVTFTLNGNIPFPTSATAYNSSGAIGSSNGTANPGSNTMGFEITPQPDGTPIYVRVQLGELFQDSASVGCSGSGKGSGEQSNKVEWWSGFHDGRSNPAMDEFYSVWCGSDHINVYGGPVTSGRQVATFGLAAVIALADGGTLVHTGGVTLIRAGDSITVAGSNGHYPGYGSKQISLSACITSNGGIPEQQQGQNQQPAQPEASDDLSGLIDPSDCSFLDLIDTVDCGTSTLLGSWLAWLDQGFACPVPALVLVPAVFIRFRHRKTKRV
jgi:hypothetical protein